MLSADTRTCEYEAADTRKQETKFTLNVKHHGQIERQVSVVGYS